MIALMKMISRFHDSYVLLGGEDLADLWEGAKASGMGQHYRAMQYICDDQEAIDAYHRFDRAVAAGEENWEEFACFVFQLEDVVYSCCEIVDNDEGARSLLLKLRNDYLPASGVVDYKRTISYLLRSSEKTLARKFQKQPVCFSAFRRNRAADHKGKKNSVPTLSDICFELLILRRNWNNPELAKENPARGVAAEKLTDTMGWLFIKDLSDISYEELEEALKQMQAFQREYDEPELDEPIRHLTEYCRRIKEKTKL